MYEIPRRGRSCSVCEMCFSQGDTYFSALKEERGVSRLDFCATCWKNKPFKIFWKGVVPCRKEPPKYSVDRAFHFLREALLENDFSFALSIGLSLMRKKKIILRQELEEVYLFEIVETEEMLTLKKVPLTDEVLKESQERLENAIPS